MTAPVLDVVIPVHNEQHTVAASVRRLHAHLVETFPYPFRITVADNASTDATVAVASVLAAELPGVALARLAQKGRGRALKQVWLASDAPILAYMDVDLSTDLDALWPLVAPLMSGHSDLAIGSRLARGSRVVRGARREVISRCYNLVLKGALGAGFTDAQCGFKAIRADVATELLPLVEDPTWFFDTELLVLAQRSGLRIHEVPVDWFDDPDSRVDVVATALDDVRGVVRLRRGLASGRLPVADIAARIGRRAPSTGTWRQASRFAAVGVVSTVIHLGLFASLASALASTQAANLVALLLASLANTGLNRRWTFGIRGAGRLRSQVQGLAVFGITWLMTAGALALLHAVVAAPSTVVATFVVGAATATSTVVRFVAMRSWIFRGGPLTTTEQAALDQYSVRMNEPSSSSNTTIPVQSKPSTEPWQTVTSP
ncbi:bifunctional glycosyltransferase family 2/GtrA family protein [Phycicoccus sp. Soil803]|uniref:bifunctional glycosyltransferase family 2/GtrA family protein n=1 Tax=Phycicoccus sp. Soil803 TaxID=1736415 RepID=UPI0009EAD5BD|nr:bifunctional glycosyltransferase family 2/GtrA family protein [Phycicoccus sp. Soil803]